MKEIRLFQTQDGAWITNTSVAASLERVKAAEASILYMHTGLTFGMPNPELGRQGLLEALYETVASLGTPTLLVPTFTFSFCNGEDYNVQTSRSRMGALNEFIRKLPGTIRTVDPLMSSALVGKERELVQDLGKHSVGENSTFDKLHRRGAAVKFLFLGTTVSECYTYTHYVEERLRTPYRYDREFTGNITDSGRSWRDTYTLFVRYQGVVPISRGILEPELLRRGFLRVEPCGASSISCVGEPEGYQTIVEQLEADGAAYLDADPGDRNTFFQARNMVAL